MRAKDSRVNRYKMARRCHQFNLLLSDEEKAWLEEIATSRGLTSSDVLRQYIRETTAALVERRALDASQPHGRATTQRPRAERR